MNMRKINYKAYFSLPLCFFDTEPPCIAQATHYYLHVLLLYNIIYTLYKYIFILLFIVFILSNNFLVQSNGPQTLQFCTLGGKITDVLFHTWLFLLF